MRSNELKRRIFKVVSAIIIVGLIGDFIFAKHAVRHTYEVTVTDKQVKRHDEKTDKYLIYVETKDGQTKVFEDTDTLLEWKFNSSDIYGRIKVNKSYKINTYGFRIPIISLYENIVDVQEVK